MPFSRFDISLVLFGVYVCVCLTECTATDAILLPLFANTYSPFDEEIKKGGRNGRKRRGRREVAAAAGQSVPKSLDYRKRFGCFL